jgi:hypothetical protein
MPLFLGCRISEDSESATEKATTNSAIAKNTSQEQDRQRGLILVVSGNGTGGATPEAIMNDYTLMILDLLSLSCVSE